MKDADSPAMAYLQRVGAAGEGPHDIAQAALMLSALDHPDRALDPYRAHLEDIAGTARREIAPARNVGRAAQGLSAVLYGRFGYEGDRSTYDDLQNADLMSVIDRRRGLPVALGILYLHAARAAGLQATGLFAPGHFLLSIGVKGNDALIDPFNAGSVIDRERALAPDPPDPRAPDPRFTETLPPGVAFPIEQRALEPVSDSEVLLRLLNNIKSRAASTRDTVRVAESLRRMTTIAPLKADLWFELGKTEEALSALAAARHAYERALMLAARPDEVFDSATFALQALKRRLN